MSAHDEIPDDMTAAEFWDGMYGEHERRWSGNPNAMLVEMVTGRRPGRAIDLGCGEGADSIWLAQQGWEVLGVDVSATALDRAANAARSEGVSDKITWVEADLSDWEPDGQFDLVSAFFFQSPIELPRERILNNLSKKIQVDGRLLVVGHAEWPPWSKRAQTEAEGNEAPEPLPSASEVWESLNLKSNEWHLEICDDLARDATGPDGQTGELIDSVVLARRLPS